MNGLLEDPDRTDLVNEIVEALDGGRRRRFQRRIWGSAEAKRLLAAICLPLLFPRARTWLREEVSGEPARIA